MDASFGRGTESGINCTTRYYRGVVVRGGVINFFSGYRGNIYFGIFVMNNVAINKSVGAPREIGQIHISSHIKIGQSLVGGGQAGVIK